MGGEQHLHRRCDGYIEVAEDREASGEFALERRGRRVARPQAFAGSPAHARHHRYAFVCPFTSWVPDRAPCKDAGRLPPPEPTTSAPPRRRPALQDPCAQPRPKAEHHRRSAATHHVALLPKGWGRSRSGGHGRPRAARRAAPRRPRRAPRHRLGDVLPPPPPALPVRAGVEQDGAAVPKVAGARVEPPGRRLHAILIQPRLVAAALPGAARRGARARSSAASATPRPSPTSPVHFHELLILEKPPGCRRRSASEGAEPTVAGVPLTATPVLEAQESSEAVNAQLAASAMEQPAAQDTAVAAAARAASDPSLAVAAAATRDGARRRQARARSTRAANYRMMFSLYRKDSDAPPCAERRTRCSRAATSRSAWRPTDILIRQLVPHAV